MAAQHYNKPEYDTEKYRNKEILALEREVIMTTKLHKLTFFFLLFLLVGCSPRRSVTTIDTTVVASQSPVHAPVTSPTVEEYTLKKSDPGMITVHGTLLVMDPTVMLPDPNDGIFLVPLSSGDAISTIPPFVVGEVPQADVDERTGEFVFINLQPGKYAVVVLTRAGAQIPARIYEKDSLAIFDLDESHTDKIFEIDYLSLP